VQSLQTQKAFRADCTFSLEQRWANCWTRRTHWILSYDSWSDLKQVDLCMLILLFSYNLHKFQRAGLKRSITMMLSFIGFVILVAVDSVSLRLKKKFFSS